MELARTLYKDPRLDGRPDTNLSRIFKGHGTNVGQDKGYVLLTDFSVDVFFDIRGHSVAAIAFSEGQIWKDIRKFEIMALKDFGRGKLQ